MDSNLSSGQWHVSLHFTTDQFDEQTLQWRDCEVRHVAATAQQLAAPFPAKFDQFVDSINEMSGGYAEGDGSYGVVGPGGAWKICGNVFENLDAIQYAELLGSCPVDQLRQFVALLGCSSEQCLFQNLQGGFFQTFDQFVGEQPKPS